MRRYPQDRVNVGAARRSGPAALGQAAGAHPARREARKTKRATFALRKSLITITTTITTTITITSTSTITFTFTFTFTTTIAITITITITITIDWLVILVLLEID